jgi:heme exporter protein B
MKKKSTSLPTGPSASALEIGAVWAKEARSELRTRHALNAMLLFAVTSVVVVGFSTARAAPDGFTVAALFWIVLFFSAMSSLAHVFVKEEDTQTGLALRLAARPSAVYFGKLLFNAVLLSALAALVTPLFIGLVNMKIYQWNLFWLTLALGVAGLAGATTIVAAIVARASIRGALFAVLCFPILLPLLLAAVGATQAAMDPAAAANATDELRLLLAYLVAMTTGSWLLFDFVWWA